MAIITAFSDYDYELLAILATTTATTLALTILHSDSCDFYDNYDLMETRFYVKVTEQDALIFVDTCESMGKSAEMNI